MANLHQIISDDLRIPPCYLNVQDEVTTLCLVHEKWLQKLLLTHVVPSEFILHSQLSEIECELLLRQRERHLNLPWQVVEIRALKKSNTLVPKLRKCQKISEESRRDLDYSQLLHYISETNFKNLWKETYNRHCFTQCDIKHDQPEMLASYTDVIREALRRLYCCSTIPVGSMETVPVKGTSTWTEEAYVENGCHKNILPALCVVESESNFYVIHPHIEHSIADCVTFSSSILGNSTMKPLFVVYQILHAIRYLHDRGLCLGDVTLQHLHVNDNLWVHVHPIFWQNLMTIQDCGQVNLKQMGQCSYLSEQSVKKPSLSEVNSMPLNDLTNLWVQGAISNYDYLIALNGLAGRKMGNPNYHPVLPWVMDFTVQNGGWRDLSRSKFRLNKGDRQLDMTYESLPSMLSGLIGSEAVQVPHHVTDVLSEITYYVYKARQTPKSVLCQYVRSNWVPAEYPSSMQRLYDWTPDECIPEFFTDATIFRSIHDDLPDLDIPWWASSADDFVHKHRAALEGFYVSDRLHRWIDLTFGYKLSGPAAVKAKNVCLHLVDQHTVLTSGGVVQLFYQPHPHRLSLSPYSELRSSFYHSCRGAHHRELHKKHATGFESEERLHSCGAGVPQELASNQDNLDLFKFAEKKKSSIRLKESTTSTVDTANVRYELEYHQIALPKDYNPLAMLSQLEALYNFTTKTTYKPPKEKPQNEDKRRHSFHQQTTRDMVVLGCLVVEIFMAAKIRTLHFSATLDERYAFIRSLLKVNCFDLPRCARQAVHLLLQLGSNHTTVPTKMPTVTDNGLPPPSAHQLLQSLIQVFPFPHYFSVMYSFICNLMCYSRRIRYEQLYQLDLNERSSRIDKVSETQVKMAATLLPEILEQLNEEGLQLLIPYLGEMFENQHSSVMTAWYLFNMVGQMLGPQQTSKKFLKPLVRLYDPDCSTPKHLKLFHRSYLLQLLIRLGLHIFLTHFSTLLVEAVSGFKDFRDKTSSCVADSQTMRKGSHLRSPVLESLVHDDDVQTADDEGALSPFDESLSQTEIASPWSRSEADNSSAALAGDHYTEPEIFTFEATEDELCGEASDRLDVDIDVEQYEQKLCESSSDSTSVDAISIGDTNIESGHSPVIEEEDEIDRDSDKLNPSSFSEGFQMRRISKSCSLSSSVPNIPSAFAISKNGEEMKASEASESATCTSNLHAEKQHKTVTEYNISDVASESLTWLSHRLGPVLTAKYLSRNLLRMVSLCYLGDDQQEFANDIDGRANLDEGDLAVTISPKEVLGDRNASKVFDCLTSIASLYGEQFIMLQYLPHAMEIVCQCKKRLTPGCEAGLIGVVALVVHVVPYLSSQTLMDHLQDVMIKEILYPSVCLVSSQRVTFPGGGHARQVIAFKILDALHLIGLRIGFEMARKHLTSILQRFFSAFSKVHGKHKLNATSSVASSLISDDRSGRGTAFCCDRLSDQSDRLRTSCESNSPPISDKNGHHIQQMARSELSVAFTPELAYVAYIPFCKLAGSIYMERNVTNDELIHQLCLQHDQALSVSSFADYSVRASEVLNRSRDQSGGIVEPASKEMSLVGNRIGIHLEQEELVPAGATPLLTSPPGNTAVKIAEYPKCDITKLISKQMENDYRHLRGNWFAYWEHEIGRNEKDHRFNFKQIKLQTFVGHISNVRAIHVLDNENSFISASKDKTVKLWSLRSHGTGVDHVPCRYTYTSHKKSVFSVTFLESLRLVASCDSTVHVWDPFMGSLVKQFDPMKNSPVTVLTAMSAPSRVILAATTESTVRFLDVKSLQFVHDFKVSLGSAGLIRCLGVSPDGRFITVGHSAGIISLLDVRTGLMINSWKAHEGEVLQIKFFNSNTFVSSSLDQCVSVWNADDGKFRCHLRGPTEPVHCLGFYRNEMISGTTASRVGIHTSIDSQASFSSTRLRSDTFKGVLTCLTVLPLNRLLLLGADNGAIRLLC